MVLSVIFFIFLFNLFWDFYKNNILTIGYITTDNVPVKNDFNFDANDIMTVNDGTKIMILGSKEKFLYVKFLDGTKGWIEKNKVIY